MEAPHSEYDVAKRLERDSFGHRRREKTGLDLCTVDSEAEGAASGLSQAFGQELAAREAVSLDRAMDQSKTWPCLDHAACDLADTAAQRDQATKVSCSSCACSVR